MISRDHTKRIILFAESGSDVPQDVARQYDIQIVPMHITFDTVSKPDGTFPSEDIVRFYKETHILPKTSCSTPQDFSNAFDAIHAAYPEAKILHLAYSAATTASYSNARLAAKGRDYVTSVDTKFASAGQAAIVIRMARLLEQHPDWDVATAVTAAESLVSHCRMCFIPAQLEFLRAGGRLTNAASVVGTILNIHPLIEMKDGILVATRKLRGKMERLVPKLVTNYIQTNHLEKDEIWLIRTPGLPDSSIAAAEEAARLQGVKTVTWIRTGGVITTHGGPGAFGVVGFSQSEGRV